MEENLKGGEFKWRSYLNGEVIWMEENLKGGEFS